MARICEGKLYKLRCMVGGVVQPPIVFVDVQSAGEADTAAILHYADQPEHAGKEVRILSATEIELESL